MCLYFFKNAIDNNLRCNFKNKEHMKNTIQVCIIILAVLSSTVCYDNPEPNPNGAGNGITYPEEGLFGENVLSETTPALAIGIDYSFNVKTTGNATVRIAFSNNIEWDYASDPPPIGWSPETIIDRGDYTLFYANFPANYDLKLYFTGPGQNAYGEIKIYENDSAVATRVVILEW